MVTLCKKGPTLEQLHGVLVTEGLYNIVLFSLLHDNLLDIKPGQIVFETQGLAEHTNVLASPKFEGRLLNTTGTVRAMGSSLQLCGASSAKQQTEEEIIMLDL